MLISINSSNRHVISWYHIHTNIYMHLLIDSHIYMAYAHICINTFELTFRFVSFYSISLSLLPLKLSEFMRISKLDNHLYHHSMKIASPKSRASFSMAYRKMCQNVSISTWGKCRASSQLFWFPFIFEWLTAWLVFFSLQRGREAGGCSQVYNSLTQQLCRFISGWFCSRIDWMTDYARRGKWNYGTSGGRNIDNDKVGAGISISFSGSSDSSTDGIIITRRMLEL